MVKLFTDEEMNEKCKDYDPIPLKVAQDILHQEEREDRVNILNGVVKSPYRIGQPPSSVNMYASQIGMMTPIKPDAFLKEYNRVVDKRVIETEVELEQDIDELNEELYKAEQVAPRFRMVAEGMDAPPADGVPPAA